MDAAEQTAMNLRSYVRMVALPKGHTSPLLEVLDLIHLRLLELEHSRPKAEGERYKLSNGEIVYWKELVAAYRQLHPEPSQGEPVEPACNCGVGGQGLGSPVSVGPWHRKDCYWYPASSPPAPTETRLAAMKWWSGMSMWQRDDEIRDAYDRTLKGEAK